MGMGHKALEGPVGFEGKKPFSLTPTDCRFPQNPYFTSI